MRSNLRKGADPSRAHLPLFVIWQEDLALASTHDIMCNVWWRSAREILAAIDEQFIGSLRSVEHNDLLRTKFQSIHGSVFLGPFSELIAQVIDMSLNASNETHTFG